MKAILSILVSLGLPLNAKADEAFERELKSLDTVQKVSVVLYELIQKPGSLTLTIKDDETLESALKSLRENNEKIGALAKHLSSRPKPTEADKAAMAKTIEEREAKAKAENEPKFRAHLQQMDSQRRTKWMQAVQGFYRDVDKHSEILKPYFEAAGPK